MPVWKDFFSQEFENQFLRRWAADSNKI